MPEDKLRKAMMARAKSRTLRSKISTHQALNQLRIVIWRIKSNPTQIISKQISIINRKRP